jgi:hypothetical protein
MTVEITPFAIKIQPINGGRYKSISTLTWQHVPGLAILTGKNGSGKTQLLEILAYHFSGAIPSSPKVEPLQVSVNVVGTNYGANEIGYIPSGGRFSGGGAASIAQMPSARQQQIQLVQNPNNYRHDISSSVRAKKILNLLGERNPHSISPDEIAELFTDDFDFMIGDADPTDGFEPVPEICTGR